MCAQDSNTISGVGVARVSEYIDRRQIGNFFKGIRHANRIGRPLNLFVTINFKHTACSPQDASKCFEKIRVNHFIPWLAYQSRKSKRLNFGRPTFVWVIENSGEDIGPHWLVHIPERLQDEFRKKVARWLETCAGPVSSPQALDIRKAPSPLGAGLYMAKGINPKYAKFYGIRPKAQGKVHGKRCGTSNNLSRTARELYNMRRVAA